MSGTMYWSQKDYCWYVPVSAPLLLAELEDGISPVEIRLQHGQMVVTRLNLDALVERLGKEEEEDDGDTGA